MWWICRWKVAADFHACHWVVSCFAQRMCVLTTSQTVNIKHTMSVLVHTKLWLQKSHEVCPSINHQRSESPSYFSLKIQCKEILMKACSTLPHKGLINWKSRSYALLIRYSVVIQRVARDSENIFLQFVSLFGQIKQADVALKLGVRCLFFISSSTKHAHQQPCFHYQFL